jgi:hypothetical protein
VSFFDQMFPKELYERALEIEFQLAYHSSLGSVASWQTVAVFERDWHFAKLRDTKIEEKKEHEQHMARLQAKSSSRR